MPTLTEGNIKLVVTGATGGITPAAQDALDDIILSTERAEIEANRSEAAAYTSGQLLAGFDDNIVTGTQTIDRGPVASGSNSVTSKSYLIGTVEKDGLKSGAVGSLQWYAVAGTAAPIIAVEQPDGSFATQALSFSGAPGSQTSTFTVTGEGGARVFLHSPNNSARFAIGTADWPYFDGSPVAAVNPEIKTAAGVPKVILTWNYSQVADKGEVNRRLSVVEGQSVPLDGVYMGSSANNSFAKDALAAVLSGTASMLAITIGDSITAGSHNGLPAAEGGTGTAADGVAIPADGSIGYFNAHRRNYSAQAADLLRGPLPDGLAIPTTYEGFHGYNNPQGSYLDYNQQVSNLGDWTNNSSPAFTTLGGGAFQSTSSGDGSPLVWTTRTAVSKIVIYSYGRAGSAQEYSIDGAAYVAIDTNANNTYIRTEITVPLGIHTVRLRRVGATTAYFAGMFAWDDTVKSVRILPMGFPGSTATTSHAAVRTNPWSPGNLIETFAAPLKFIALGTNDIDDNKTVEAFIAAMQQLITSAMKNSTVVVLGMPPQYDDGGASSVSRQRQFRFGLKALCAELGAIFVDRYALFGDYATAVQRGLMDDALHTTYLGATVDARAVNSVIGRLL